MPNFCDHIETPQAVATENHAAHKLSLEATTCMPNQKLGKVKVSFGQVENVTLRTDWEAGVSQETPARFTEYHSSQSPETKLCFYYRGYRLSETSSATFAQLLDKPDHALSKSEIKSLQEVLGVRADEQTYKILDARTQQLNGKHVLILRGKYLDKQYENESVFVDSDGSGSAVQEIYWQSPKADYVAQGQAKAALRSITWK